MDYNSFYAAGVAIENRLNLYEVDTLNSDVIVKELSSYDTLAISGPLPINSPVVEANPIYPYVYPPPLAIAMGGSGYILKRVLLLLLSVICLGIIGSITEYTFSYFMKKSWAKIFSSVLVLTGPGLYILYVGQVDLFIAATAISLFYYNYYRNNNYNPLTRSISGVLAGIITLIKPHSFLLLFFIPLMQKGDRIKYIASAIICLLLTVVFYPEIYQYFFEFLLNEDHSRGLMAPDNKHNASLQALLLSWQIEEYKLFAYIIACSIALLSIVSVINVSNYTPQEKALLSMSLLVPSVTLAMPYLWHQHHIYILISGLIWIGIFSIKDFGNKYVKLVTLIILVYFPIVSFGYLIVDRFGIAIPHYYPIGIILTILGIIFLLRKTATQYSNKLGN